VSDLDLSLDAPEGASDTLGGRENLVGDRLRDIRHQQGLSLAEVETRSGGAWKAVVVGAYERGDRAVTISRLADLAEFYGVPLGSLLPTRTGAPAPQHDAEDDEPRRRAADDDGRARLKLDLQRLDEADTEDLDPIALRAVARFAEHIQLRRGDHNGRVLTVRADDLRTIAVAIGHDPARLIESLRDQGAVVTE
jgi:transcriptional regulator with XRE-family HTH domain